MKDIMCRYAFLQEMLIWFFWGAIYIPFFVRLPIPNAWNWHSLYTAFSSNVGAWGMWACSLFLSLLGWVVDYRGMSSVYLLCINCIISFFLLCNEYKKNTRSSWISCNFKNSKGRGLGVEGGADLRFEVLLSSLCKRCAQRQKTLYGESFDTNDI